MGTAAGLAIGLALADLRTEIQAVRVTDPLIMNETALRKLIGKIALMLRRIDPTIPADLASRVRIVVRDDYFAGGYAETNEATDAAVRFGMDSLDMKLPSRRHGPGGRRQRRTAFRAKPSMASTTRSAASSRRTRRSCDAPWPSA